MEENNVQVDLQGENLQPVVNVVDDHVGEDGARVENAPRVENNPRAGEQSSKNWNGYKIPQKRKTDNIKGSSKRRKENSKFDRNDEDLLPEATCAGARAALLADDGDGDFPPSSSDSSSDSDILSDDSSDSESSDNDEVRVVPPKKINIPVGRPPVQAYSRFDPGEGDHVSFHLPYPDMINYATKSFTRFVRDKKIKETILEDHPVPSDVPGVEVPTVDEYVTDIFANKKHDYGKFTDDTYMKLQTRVVDIMGPLSQLWSIFEKARLENEEPDIDLFECLDLIEKVITLTGQVNCTLLHDRRLSIMYKLTRSATKAKQLLKHLDISTLPSHDKLFGKAFYRRLVKSSKVRKQSKEISSQLGDGKKKQYHGNKQNQNAGYSGQGGQGAEQQPFREGPSSRGGGGGRRVSLSKRGRGGKRGKCLVKLCVSKRSQIIDRHTKRDRRTVKFVNCSIKSKCSIKDEQCRNKTNSVDIRRAQAPRDVTSLCARATPLAHIFAKRSGGRLRLCLESWKILTNDQLFWE